MWSRSWLALRRAATSRHKVQGVVVVSGGGGGGGGGGGLPGLRRRFARTPGPRSADEIEKDILGPEGVPRWDFSGHVNWFPGHMARGAREAEEQIRDVNAIVEVRDARIPFTSRNPRLDHLLQRKNRVVVLNKADLADPSREEETIARIVAGHTEGSSSNGSASGPGKVSALYTSCHGQTHRNLGKVIPLLAADMKLKFNTLGGLILILGIPNVGKSTIINTIRRMSSRRDRQGEAGAQGGLQGADRRQRGRARQSRKSKTVVVGAQPGVTKNVSKVQVWDRPTMFMMDSPGIMYPKIEDSETGLKLTLTGAIKDKIIGEEILVDYLVYKLTQQSPAVQEQAAKAIHLDAPSLTLNAVLDALGSESVGKVNAARKLLRLYRAGTLGSFCLDELS